MSSKAADVLARNSVFQVLSPARRRMLAENGSSVQLSKDDVLFRRGDTADAAFAIIAGEIEVTIKGPDDRDVFIAKLGNGTVVGEMGVLDGVSRSADARATRRTELWRIDAKLVTEALREEPNSAIALLGVLARRIRDTDALVERTSSMDLGKRLARLLLDESVTGRIIYNQSDMAHLIGASREAVNRKLARWKKARWIELNATGLHVLDRAALLALCKRKAAL
jgi:CRP-like cAMP-binding protein